MSGIVSVGGSPSDMFILNTTSVSIALTANVIFSPDSAGTQNTANAKVKEQFIFYFSYRESAGGILNIIQ